MEKNQQYNKDNSNDENTFDDNLLLIADSSGEKIPLLKITDDGLAKGHAILSNDNPFRPGSAVLHCHVPDEKFDYSARNRLIIAFILSFTFMIIEIVGKFVCIDFYKTNHCCLPRLSYFKLDSFRNRCSTYVY